MEYIVLMNAARNEVGRLDVRENGVLEVSVSRAFSDMEDALYKMGETIAHAEITRKRQVKQGEALIELREKVEKGEIGYMPAVADFINSHRTLVMPRVFAMVKEG